MAEKEVNSKKPWQSKTVWTNLFLSAAPFIPGASDWVTSNPTTFGLVITVLNLALRGATGEPISWRLLDKKL